MVSIQRSDLKNANKGFSKSRSRFRLHHASRRLTQFGLGRAQREPPGHGLRARGAGVPDSVAAGARTLIAHELGNEAARYVFGRPAEVRRRLAEDHQVQAALALARRARSPQDLLTLAPAKIPANPRN